MDSENNIIIEEVTTEILEENELSEFIITELEIDGSQNLPNTSQYFLSNSVDDNEEISKTIVVDDKELSNEEREQLIKKFMNGELSFSEYSTQFGNEIKKSLESDEEYDSNDVKGNELCYTTDEDRQVAINPKIDSTIVNHEVTSKTSNKQQQPQKRFQQQQQQHKPTSRTIIDKNANDKQQKSLREGKPKTRCILPPALQGLMGEANICYARGKHALAEKACLEIIRQVPLAPEPFLTLAQIHEANPEKHMQYSLIAAHLNPNNVNQWMSIAQLAIEQDNVKLAINCYSNAIRANPKEIDLRLKRIELLESLGEVNMVKRAYNKLVYIIPSTNGHFLKEIAKKVTTQYHTDNDNEKALQVWKYTYDKIPQLFLNEDINLLLELLLINIEYKEVINVLCAYNSDLIVIYDNFTDDTDNDRVSYIISCNIPDNMILDFRAKLIVSLVHLKLKSEILIDYLLKNILEFIDIEFGGDCYLDIAEAFMAEEQYEHALRLLIPLLKSKNYSLAAVWLRHADCLRAIGNNDDAIVSYRKVVELAPQHFEARLILAALLKQKGCEDEALHALEQDFENELIDPQVLYERCFMLKEIGNLNKYIEVGFLLVTRNCFRLRNYDEIHFAITLTKFNERIQAIRKSREARAEYVADSDLPEFRKCDVEEIPIEKEWELFKDIVQTAFELQRYSFMQKIVFTIYTSKRFIPYKNEIDFLAMLSTIYNRHPYFSYSLVKEYVVKNPDCPRVWNLFNVVLQFTDDIRYIKFLIRLLKRSKLELMPSLIRANYCLSCGTYKYALHFLTILYRHVNDPIIPLLIGITYGNIAQQKQITKRQNVITQSLAFLHKYWKMRESDDSMHEIYYNMGRFHHQLGMASIAVCYYQKVLSHTTDLIKQHEDYLDLKREAAFNLHLIYKASDNNVLARKYLFDYIIV